MRKILYLTVVVVAFGLLIAGGTSQIKDVVALPSSNSSEENFKLTSAHMESDPFSTDLIAGGGNEKSAIDAGDVLVWNDGENLYVKYTTTPDWCLSETHLHVATSQEEIPTTPGRFPNSIPGRFEYSQEHDQCLNIYTYQVNLEEEGASYDDELKIAAHAELENQSDETDMDYEDDDEDDDDDEHEIEYEDEESAWGDGDLFNDKNWATYFTYIV